MHKQLSVCNTSIRLCEAAKHLNYFILKLCQLYYNGSYNLCAPLISCRATHSKAERVPQLITSIVYLLLWLTQTTTTPEQSLSFLTVMKISDGGSRFLQSSFDLDRTSCHKTQRYGWESTRWCGLWDTHCVYTQIHRACEDVGTFSTCLKLSVIWCVLTFSPFPGWKVWEPDHGKVGSSKPQRSKLALLTDSSSCVCGPV